MESHNSTEELSFSARLGMAWKLLVDAAFARKVRAGLNPPPPAMAKPAASKAREAEAAPERVHASGLFLLSALQREGRLIDFLQQEVTAFSDEEVGAAARVVHAGCRKTLLHYFDFEPATGVEEGALMTVPVGFDAQRVRLAGNVTGQPPFQGTLKHHGWVAKTIRLPQPNETLDPRVIAPAEVELGS